MQSLQKLVSENYKAATEEVSAYVKDYLSGNLTHLQFVERLAGNPLNISIATGLISRHKQIYTAFISALALKEVQKTNPEVSSLDDKV